MKEDQPAIDVEELLAHREFVRAVVLREPDGDPAVGVPVSLVGQGNNACERARATEKEGRIHFEGLYAARVEVVKHGIRLGRIALSPGLTTFEAVVPEESIYTLHVRFDGEPGLPGDCSVRIVNEAVSPEFEDPATGEVRFRFRGDGETVHALNLR